MLNRKNLARTSGKPGKTQLLNFFNIDDKLRFVDVPGYGYAKVSKTERAKWGLSLIHIQTDAIRDNKESIRQGVQTLSDNLELASEKKVDVWTAVQALSLIHIFPVCRKHYFKPDINN